MEQALTLALDQSRAVRIAMAGAWAYLLGTVAMGCVFAGAKLLTDWPLANDYGSSIVFFAGLGCVIWYPMAQIVAFRAPVSQWDYFGFLALINILLLSGLLFVADGAPYQSAFTFLLTALFVTSRWRQTKREAAQASP